ncbi:MAG: acetylornithine aminotransferase [Actinomycetota bacterium]|jgi:predicted acetylornithine/succinylornithine family transaminase
MTHQFMQSPVAQQANNGNDWCPFIPVFGQPSVMFERGEGTQLWDINGKRYLDFLSGIAVVSLGHSNPAVAAAISQQASQLLHVSNFFANTKATETAVTLNGLMRDAGAGDGQVFFCNSGAEANEAAIKLARKFGGRGRHVMVSALGSFHGRTLGALALTGQPAKHEPFQPMPEGFRYCEFGDIASLEKLIDPTVAAVMLEPIQGEGGVIPASAEYLQAVQKLCRERGVLLIIDEVQTGFCRTGKWFGFEHAGIQPDAVTFAKGMGNGMPVGALWARRDVAAVLQPGDHGSTYSGTALATSAVSAVIAEMKRIDAPALAQKQGDRLSNALSKLSKVDHVRGSGLLLGAQLTAGVETKDVVPVLLEKGLIVNGVNATTIRLAPPITVSDSEIDEAVALIAEVLS